MPLTFMGVTGCKITVSLPVAFGMEPLTVIWKAIRRSSGWCLQWTMTDLVEMRKGRSVEDLDRQRMAELETAFEQSAEEEPEQGMEV